MNAIERSIARARVRLFVQESLQHLGWLALGAVAVAAVVLVTQRLLGWHVPWWVYVTLSAAAVAAAPLWAWLRLPSVPAVAAIIDKRLELKDRLATALYARRLTADPFAAQVVRDAEKSAAGLTLARAFPIRPTAVWGWVLPCAALLAVLAVFIPHDALGLRASQQQAAQQRTQAQEQAKREILNAVQVMRETKPAGDPEHTNPAKAEDLKGLMELAEKNLGDPAVRREAMNRISAVQDRLAQNIDQKQQDMSALQNATSQFNPPPGPADRFAEALQRGDYGDALKALDDLMKSADSLPPDQRAALQTQLVALANQLGQLALQNSGGQMSSASTAGQPPNGGNPPAQTQPSQVSSNTQSNPSATQPSQQAAANPQSPAQTQPSQNSGQSSQQTARGSQSQAQPGQQNSSSQCQNCAQGLSQGLQQMANSMGQSPSNSGGQNPGQQPVQQPGQQSGGAQGLQQGAQQASGALQQLAQMQQQLQQMRTQQSQLNQSMNQLASNAGGGSNFTPNMFQPNLGQNSRNGGGGVGGSRGGHGDGGNPMGQERRMTGYNTEAHSEATDGQGRVIASWMENGPMAKGDPTVEFNKTITEARREAEKAIAEDRLPRQYQKAVKDYFNQLPQSPDQIQKPAAPPAPR
jgi:hypothetical protein